MFVQAVHVIRVMTVHPTFMSTSREGPSRENSFTYRACELRREISVYRHHSRSLLNSFRP